MPCAVMLSRGCSMFLDAHWHRDAWSLATALHRWVTSVGSNALASLKCGVVADQCGEEGHRLLILFFFLTVVVS